MVLSATSLARVSRMPTVFELDALLLKLRVWAKKAPLPCWNEFDWTQAKKYAITSCHAARIVRHRLEQDAQIPVFRRMPSCWSARDILAHVRYNGAVVEIQIGSYLSYRPATYVDNVEVPGTFHIASPYDRFVPGAIANFFAYGR